MRNFTEEELAIAKSVDLTKVAGELGYTVKKVGGYHTIKEMDSIRIYGRTSWFRWSRQYDKGERGGSQIDFLRVFADMEIKEAVFWLLELDGHRIADTGREQMPPRGSVPVRPEPKREFSLPAPAHGNSHLVSYLCTKRGLSQGVVRFFLDSGLIYEAEQYHNIVFKGNDVDGTTRFASMRGIHDRAGNGFKCDVAGNDKNYGFNLANKKSGIIHVFEAAIDLMSHLDIFGDWETNMLALGMLSDAPLETFLKEHPQIRKICLCLDNDDPGRKAAKELKEKYESRSYEVLDCPPPKQYKDFNHWLVETKLCQDVNRSGGRIR